MKVAKSTDFTYSGFSDGYHFIFRTDCDDYEAVRELKFIDVDSDLVYHFQRDGSKVLTSNTRRRLQSQAK